MLQQDDLDNLLRKPGVAINKKTSMSASSSEDFPLSKRKQTGRRAVEHVVETKYAEKVEAELQKKCETYLENRNIAFIRIPDALYRWIFGAKIVPPFIRKLISKYLTGVPDLVILLPNGRYLCAELKARKGKLTTGQKRFARKVRLDIFRDFESFRNEVKQRSKST